jgi:hypothetical protein
LLLLLLVLMKLGSTTTTTDLAQWRKRNGFCTIAAAVTSARHLNLKIKQKQKSKKKNETRYSAPV